MTSLPCTVFPNQQHVFTFDATGNGQDTFCCICGFQLIEFLDSQP